MAEMTPTEKALVDAVQAMLDENPAGTIAAVSRALKERGVRCLMVASGAISPPSVSVTLTIDDVTAEAVRRVVSPVLQKAGVPETAIPVMAGSAGTYAAQWLAKQRAMQVQRAQQERQEQQARQAYQATSTPWQGTKPRWQQPRWQPGPRRTGG